MGREDFLKSASIYLLGEVLCPERISEVLGVKPSRFHQKGGLKTGSKRFVAKIGMWTLKAESRSRSIPELIDELFLKIGEPPMPLDKLEGVQFAYLDIFIATDHESGINETAEFDLSKNQVSNLMLLGLSMRITVT